MSKIIIKLNGEEYIGEETSKKIQEELINSLYMVMSRSGSIFELKLNNGYLLVLSRRMVKRAVFVIEE